MIRPGEGNREEEGERADGETAKGSCRVPLYEMTGFLMSHVPLLFD